MNERQAKLLATIIDEFINTGVPVGSKQIIDHGYFELSCATIRNEMRSLGEEGFLEQPHISAGRVPTAKGYRAYVKEFMQPTQTVQYVHQKFDTLRDLYYKRKDQESVYEAVALLAQMIPNIAFATVPHKDHVYYLGLANVLRQPEFLTNPGMATGVVEILEERLNDFLDQVEVDDKVRYYIGEEHVFPQLQSCSLIVLTYTLRGRGGVIGILGPMRMDYAYNTVALELVTDLLRRT
jgi:transcriptional regulator of heat shock response